MFPINGTERARQDIAEAFEQYELAANIRKMVATRVLPQINVQLAHGNYPVIPVKELMKRVDNAGTNPLGFAAQRAPRSTYHQIDLGFTEASYTTEEHGLEGTIDRNESVHYQSHFDHEITTALKVLHDVMLEREIRTAEACFDTTRFASQTQDAGSYRVDFSVGAAVAWSDYANAQPILDIFVARQKVWNTYGVYPDCMVINERAYQHLRQVDEIRQQVMANGAGSRAAQRDLGPFDFVDSSEHMNVGATMLAQILDLDEIVVAPAAFDSNSSSNPAFSPSHVWGDSALVFKKSRVSGGAAWRDIALGHTLQWTPDTNNDPTVTPTTHGLTGAEGLFVEDYWDPTRRGQVIRVRHQDRQLIKYDVAELITNVY